MSFVLGFRYRHLDVDDWILNTVGLLLGFAAWWLFGRWRRAGGSDPGGVGDDRRLAA